MSRRVGFGVAAFAFVPFVAPAAISAQSLLAPSDPLSAIEGEWPGIYDDNRIRVANGKVTLIQVDPESSHGFKPNMVIALLNDGGKTSNKGRSYVFSSSKCLQRFTNGRGDRYEMLPCGERGATLQTYASSYQFYVSGLGFTIPRKASANSATPSPKASSPTSEPSPKEQAESATATADAETARIAAREAREAEFQAKLAAHEAGVAEYERKVAERETEIARQQAELAADAVEAARVKAAYEAKMDAHRRELAEANRRQQAYFTAQRQHAQCVNGDREACEALETGELADAGEASTDTDANRCVTSAETRTNAAFKGNTSASVLNGCGQKVDVRICLKKAAAWNCGTIWGVDPQERATHSSFGATGEVFVDARVSSSKQPLASPEGM